MSVPPKLFTPGPVDVFEETQAALGAPVPHMSHPAWQEVLAETVGMLKELFQTKNDIVLLTAAGSGAIETALASLFQEGEAVVVVRNGMFAERIVQILTTYRCAVISVDGPWGSAIEVEKVADALRAHPNAAGIAVVGNETGTGVCNPIRELAELAHDHDLPIFADLVSGMGGYDIPVDAWGLDMVASSSNKALEMAPGVGILSVNERAWDLIDAKSASAHRGWYLNLSTWKAARQRAAFPFPSTPPTLLIAGLHASLKRIIETETLAGHWARYAAARDTLRGHLRELGFEMLAADAVASPTVTTFYKLPSMTDIEDLRDYLLAEHNILIATGGGPLQGQIARVSHMGKASTQPYLTSFFDGIEGYLRQL